LEDLGLYIDNLRDVSQENCDDGIARQQCDTDMAVTEEMVWLERALGQFFQNLLFNFIDLLFYFIQY